MPCGKHTLLTQTKDWISFDPSEVPEVEEPPSSPELTLAQPHPSPTTSPHPLTSSEEYPEPMSSNSSDGNYGFEIDFGIDYEAEL